MSRTRSVLAGLSAIALLASCAPGPGPEPEPPLGNVPVVTDTKTLVLPLDSYRFTNDQYRSMLRAQSRLAGQCLARFGVAELPETTPESLVAGVAFPDFDHHNVLRYGLLDRQSAAVRGYNPAPGIAPAGGGRPDPNSPKGKGPELTQQQLFLLDGKRNPQFAKVETMPVDTKGQPLPDDGCLGEADRLLRGSAPQRNWIYAENLGTDAHHRAENDSRVQAVMASWSQCMSAKGYQYKSSRDPNNEKWPEPPGPAEIAVATADVECKLQTNLVGIWFAVEAAYQVRDIDRNAAALNEVKANLSAIVTRSAQIVGAG